MAFQAALFFDNDLGYCRSFSPYSNRITPFHVGGIQAPGDFPIVTWPDMEAYRQALSPAAQNYMAYLIEATAPSPPENQGDVLDLSSGLTYEHCQFILNALLRKSALHGVPANVLVIFDFDRTLSLFEGFLGADSPPVPAGSGIQGYLTFLQENWPTTDAAGSLLPLTADGFIEYIFGGLQRKAMIQYLIHQIALLGHSIVILTNNGVAINNSQMLKEFFPGDEAAINIICSRTNGGNKPLALHAAHPVFNFLFAAPQPPADQFIITLDRTPGQYHYVRRDYFKRNPPVSQVVTLETLYPVPPPGLAGARKRRSRTIRRNRKQGRSRKN